MGRGIYPVKNALDLMMSSMNIMMDANLMLQVGYYTIKSTILSPPSLPALLSITTIDAIPPSPLSKPIKTLNQTLNPTHLQLRLAKTETLFRTATPSPGGYQPWPAPLNQPAHHEAPPAAPGRLPEVIILSCGDMNPFDFQLSKANHRELYNSGQLSVHLHAVQWGVYHPTRLPTTTNVCWR